MQWILKMTGAFLVFATGALLGLRQGQLYMRRAEMLLEMTTLLRHVEQGLRFRRDTTCDLLSNALAACRLRVLPFTPDMQLDATRLPEALQQALNRLATETQTLLTDADRHTFSEALLRLGHGQAQEEMQNLAFAIASLEESHRTASQEAAVQSKLYRALGLSGGAALAVLLL